MCPSGTSEPLPCERGRFSNVTGLFDQSQCSPCPMGHVCSKGSITPTPCSPGSYAESAPTSSTASAEKLAICTPCDKGHFQPMPAQTACETCKAGKHQQLFGAVDCQLCQFGASSTDRALECAVCAQGFVRPLASSPSGECRQCLNSDGVTCPWNTTRATLVLDHGYWRASDRTMETWECERDGEWSPCTGGGFAGGGDGGGSYCSDGHHGPRCELCVQPNHYFKNARCEGCGDLSDYVWLFVGVLAAILAVVGSVRWLLMKRELPKNKVLRRLIKRLTGMLSVWRSAGMRPKLKIFFGVFQCVAVVPSAFNVSSPDDLEFLTEWLEAPLKLGADLLIPGRCFGGYLQRMLFSTLWPFALLAPVTVVSFAAGALKSSHRRDRLSATVRGGLKKVGLNALPLMLVLTFVMLPSCANRIFRTYLCDEFRIDDDSGLTRAFLHDDLRMECYTSEHDQAVLFTVGLLALWPVGVPVLYTTLLCANRKPILGKAPPTHLSRVIAFLSDDFHPGCFFWEPVDQLRKLGLTGFILLIPAEHEQARVLVALTLSLFCLMLQLVLRPYRRSEDNVLMMLVQVAPAPTSPIRFVPVSHAPPRPVSPHPSVDAPSKTRVLPRPIPSQSTVWARADVHQRTRD